MTFYSNDGLVIVPLGKIFLFMYFLPVRFSIIVRPHSLLSLISSPERVFRLITIL